MFEYSSNWWFFQMQKQLSCNGFEPKLGLSSNCCNNDLSVLHHLMSHQHMSVQVRSKEIILQDGRTSIHVGTL